MRLISWTLQSGSEHFCSSYKQKFVSCPFVDEGKTENIHLQTD
jgi:hypothetical protein